MSDVGKCYDNARMESFFATLKKEKLYRINTAKLTVERVKKNIFRYVMIYYNRKRISTVNPCGWTQTVYRENQQLLVQLLKFRVFLNCTKIDFFSAEA